MKKVVFRITSSFMAVLLLTCATQDMETVLAEAAAKTTDTSWYVKQFANPFKDSCWTFAYYNGFKLHKMEKHMPAAASEEPHWRSQSEKSWFGSWFANVSPAESAVAVFDPGEAVEVTVNDMHGPLAGGNNQAAYMIVQQNSSGKVCPVYPTRKKWEYKALTGAKPTLGIKAYLAAGDKLLFVYKCTGGNWAQVSSTPQITYEASETDAGSLRSADDHFTAWPDRDLTDGGGETGDILPDPANDGYTHSGLFSKKSAVNSPFSYEFGYNGDYGPLIAYYQPWSCWRNGETPPSVGSFYIGAATKLDGVIAFTAPKNGDVDIGSTLPLKLDENNAAQCDGVGVMIVQQHADSFYPLWPKKGGFSWQVFKKDSAPINLSGLSTKVKKGDRILYVTRSMGGDIGDVVNLDPTVAYRSAGNLAYPSFVPWENQPVVIPDPTDGIFQFSTYFTPDSARNGPFSSRYGREGGYEAMETFHSGWSCWTNIGSGACVGSYWVSGITDLEAVIAFTVPKDGLATITSESPVKLTFPEESDGAGVIVVLRNANGEHPLWPVKGKWEYKEITGLMEVPLAGVTEYLKAGDEILFIGHSMGSPNYDSTEISPCIKMDYSAKESGDILPAVKRVILTEEDLIAQLPYLEELKIDPPAGKPGGMAQENNGKFPFLLLAAGGAALIAAVAVVTILFLHKRRAKAPVEGDSNENRENLP